MKLTDIDNFFDKSDNKDVVGINFEKSIQPLDDFKYNEELPENADVWLNLDAISSSYDYTDLKFSMTRVENKYYVFVDEYQKYSKNYNYFKTFNNSQAAIDFIINTLKSQARYEDLNKWLIYKD